MKAVLAAHSEPEAHALLDEPAVPFPAPVYQGTPGPPLDPSRPFSDMARAREYVEEGNQQQAEAFYLQSISVLEKLNDFTAQWNLETSLDQLGELYRKEHRYSDSEKVLLRAFAAWEKQASAPPMTGPGTCDPLQTLERLYRDQGRLPQIEPFYERVVRLQERAKEQDVWDTTITLTGLANVYSEEGKHEATLPLFQRMLAVEEAKWDETIPGSRKRWNRKPQSSKS